MSILYNNKIISLKERMNFCQMADETIKEFSETIVGMHELMTEMRSLPDSEFNKVFHVVFDVMTFIGFSFCDCVVLAKYFIMTDNSYEKSLFRGKLHVLLNESFKKLYGFKSQCQKESYSAKLADVMYMFPEFQAEYNDIMSDLHSISEKNTWWKEERDLEVHIDADKLYASRLEPVNESKIMIETYELTSLHNRLIQLMKKLNMAYSHFMETCLAQK